MRLRRQRAQRHARGHEAAANAIDRFDPVQTDGRSDRTHIDQVAQLDRSLLLDRFAIASPCRHIIAAHGRLEFGDNLGRQGMPVACGALAVETADRQAGLIPGPRLAVQVERARLQTGQPDPGNPADHARQVGLNEGTGQTQNLEIAAAAIGGHDGNAHLGQDFQQAAIQRILETPRPGAGPALTAQSLPAGGNRVEGEIGVHGRRPQPNQHRSIMRVETLGRAHIERTEITQAFARQRGMHGTGHQDHRQGDMGVVLTMVGQHQMRRAVTHGCHGMRNDPVQCRTQGMAIAGSAGNGHQAVEFLDRAAHVLAPAIIGAIGQDRAVEHQHRGTRLALGQDIAEIAETGLQPHHPAFAQRVDGRIGDLREILPEEVRQWPVSL